jgi:hypothetical protein
MTNAKTYGEALQVTQPNATLATVHLRAQDLRFVAFWHPFVSTFIAALNRDGIDGLLTLENQQQSLDDPANLFHETYVPTGNVATPLPKADVDFEPGGAYSLYNWELFFHAPLLIANRLRQEQRFDESLRWLRYIFDPLTDEPGPTPRRFWRVRPFSENDAYEDAESMLELLSYTGDDVALLDRKAKIEQQLQDWTEHPFDPHRIAGLRPAAYQKNVVMRYIDTLLEYGDALFARATIESINEATQLYVLASQILGRRPERVPPRSTVEPKTYNDLKAHLDDFSNAAVQFENVLFPYDAPSAGGDGGADSIVGAGRTLYFCAPNNDQLLSYWDEVEDRLFKIRHCLNIEGTALQLPLFEPPIDPGALVRAAAAGADVSSVLDEIFAPLPRFRFSYLLQKANEICSEVKALGGQLLAALEKKDAEQLGQIRAGQELALLKLVRDTKQQQIDEALSAKVALEKSKAVADARHDFYAVIERVSSFETEQLDRLEDAQTRQEVANALQLVVGVMAAIPDFQVGTEGSFGTPHATVRYGGTGLSIAARSAAEVATWMAGYESYKANLASIQGSQDRRWADWKLSEQLADLESKQIQQQIDGADLRWQIAQKELASHDRQIEHSAQTEEFLRRKYTNADLYGWTISQVSAIYFQAYKLAYDLARKAERAYRFERGLDASDFIHFGYWDGLQKGLLAGERLGIDLRRLEAAYVDANRREYELSRRVSLVLHDPAALIALKTTGRCEVDLPEELFDADYPGQFFRRVKSASITIPCVTGPYTSINCTLTLLSSKVRTRSEPADYRETPPADSRFRYDFVAVQSIATSTGQNDSGLFELSFRDERYLPFEGAGAISRWRIDLPLDSNAFDFETISDVILKLDYTAREGGELLRGAARGALETSIKLDPGDDGALQPPLRRLFSARHEFSNEWHRYLHPEDPAGPHTLAIQVTPEHYPYALRNRPLRVVRVDLYLWPKEGASPVPSEGMPLTLTLPDGSTSSAALLPPPVQAEIALPRATVGGLDIHQPTGTFAVEIAAGTFAGESVRDLLVVVTYHVGV